jgi:hypothetical protein
VSQPTQRRHQLLPALALFALFGADACADGFASSSESPPPPSTLVDAGGPVYTGESCNLGDRESCDCPNGGQGMKACMTDATSPTQGSYSSCLLCPDSTGHNAAGSTMTMTSAGSVSTNETAGTGSAVGPGNTSSGSVSGGGGGGRAGVSGSTSTAAGSGSSTAGSSGGNTPGKCNCKQSCFPLGVLACCRANGTCGCTWAPGAYCM